MGLLTNMLSSGVISISFVLFLFFRNSSSIPLVGMESIDQPLPLAPSPDENPVTKTSFLSGFVSSFSMIIVSELGDKTFFIAAVMAMRHARGVVFMGAITALAIMTVLSGI